MNKPTPDKCAGIIRRVLAGNDTVPPEQFSDAAAQCVQALKEGTLTLFGTDASTSLLDFDGSDANGRPAGTLAAVKKLAALHPVFAEFCRKCEEAAADCNNAAMRLGYYFCCLSPDGNYNWQINWIKNSTPAYRDLYIELDFLLLSDDAGSCTAIGTYCNYGISQNTGSSSFFIEHSQLDTSAFHLHNSNAEKKNESQKLVKRYFAGKEKFPCPFCGHKYVKSGLMGRKCPDCKKILPKS